MTLIAILVGTLAAGIGSVWLAALLSFGMLARYTTHMLSLAAGALLATAFMHLLPEAFESQAGAQELFATLLVGLVFFFLLDKAELYHHGHEHHDPKAGGDDAGHMLAPVRTANSIRAERVNTVPVPLDHGHHHHHHSHHHNHGARSGSWAVLTGDSVHAFGDGILIASAFVADMRLGIITSLAVLAHEIPHHMGDLVVLRHTSSDQRTALIKVSLAGAVTALGGAVGYFLVDMLGSWLPYFLVVASSSFLYVALADLIPQLQKRLSARETAAQICWLAVGIALVTLVSGLAHSL
ncbi:MAG TPA: ZIP family metal transporter [Polaromonas sp.]|uniref:ZIP family metal transporter n=1 Tax=Polaromonas sp. TaxID=1869339 RepID=UPI002D42BF34|nr:ZIP family metal transporter [Polaromonas sp.]HYW57591.1 ZIP family metal transporter [Polaromonas sp.]